MSNEINQVIEAELKNMKSHQKEYNTLRERRQLLNGQLTETEVVQGELDFLKDGDEVFKLIGPVLVKQSLSEAKSNVAKRMSYIKGEMSRVGNAMGIAQTSLKESQEKFLKAQQSIKEKEAKLKK